MSADVIAVRIRATEEELAALGAYDDGELEAIIREVGFACDNCGRCCTHAFNDHVFLLDRDTAVVRTIDPTALVPAPHSMQASRSTMRACFSTNSNTWWGQTSTHRPHPAQPSGRSSRVVTFLR